jgi:hypothetical protein
MMVSLAFASCNKDDETTPIQLDSQITVSNTLQTAAAPIMGGTGGIETPIETIFGLPEGTYTISTAISNGIEFQGYLDGLYDIDLSENQITYSLVAAPDHPIYANFYRTIEANTFDRYYFEFQEAHNITSATSSNSSVNLNILSDNRIVIEIGEGFDFNPGTTFTINLN